MDYEQIEVTDVRQQAKFIAKTGARSFPLVFKEDEYLGSYTHMLHLHSHGRLAELVDPDDAPPLEKAAAGAELETPAQPSALESVKQQLAGFAAWGEYRKKQRR